MLRGPLFPIANWAGSIRRASGLLAGPMLLVLSLPFLFFGWRLYQDTQAYVAASQRATGRVVTVVARQKTDMEGNPSTYFYPVVEFTTPSGRVIRFQDSGGADKPYLLPRAGQTVEVLYNPDAPEVATIASWSNLWLPSAALLGAGGCFALIGILMSLSGLLAALQLGGLLTLLVALIWRQRRGPPS